MTSYDQAVAKLLATIKVHDSVLAFQKAKEKIETYPELEHLVYDMKAYQQDAVLFQKIDKEKAGQKAIQQADKLQEDLENLPIVKDYREKMQDASDLIQYITKTLEDKINKELSNGQ